MIVKNGLFLKQSDVFLSALLPLWMGRRDDSCVFQFENTENASNSVVLLKSLEDFGVFETLSKCIMGLLVYTKVKIRYSVLIHGFSRKSKVIIQDCSIGNIEILREILDGILDFESNMEQQVDTDIFSTFEEGLQALDLLPMDYLPVLVYITDGVSVARSSKLIGKSFLPMRYVKKLILWLVYGKVSLSIIQVGSENGFMPNTEFGNVPDNELLRFICILLSGRFLYAQDLPLITPNSSQADSANFYHYQLLYREADYSKVVSLNVDAERYIEIQGNTRQRLVDIPRSRVINASDTKPTTISEDELEYPWKKSSLPPIVSEILTSVREYSLPSSTCTSRLITARIREGFILRSINVSKRNKIEVTLTKPWDLHITILYTIRAYNGWSSFFPMEPSLAASATGKPLTVEVNVLAHHSFAILFVNMYMIGQTTNPAIEDLYMRLMSLDGHLKEMYALDDAMPTISAIEYLYCNNLEAKNMGNMTPEQFNKELKDYFSFITKNIVSFRPLFDTWTTDWILYSKTSVLGNKRQVAAIYLTDFLSKWSCVTMDKQTFCKMIVSERKYDVQGSMASYGFVIVKISMKTEYVGTGRLYFYNVGIEDRSKIINSLQADLNRSYFPGTTSKVMVSCKRPLRKLMVLYNLANSSSELIISNPKIREVLLKSRWIWWKKGDSDLLYHHAKHITDVLYKHRVLEGFNTVFESSKCIAFYLEHEFTDFNSTLVKLCSIQYLILISDTLIATEIWSEPLKRMGETSSREYVHSEFRNRIYIRDHNVFTYFNTYSIIQRSLISKSHNFFQTKEIFADVSKLNGFENHYDSSVIVPIKCNISALLSMANIYVIDFGFSLSGNELAFSPHSSPSKDASAVLANYLNDELKCINFSVDSLIEFRSSKRNTTIFYSQFMNLLKSFAFSVKSDNISQESLCDWSAHFSGEEKLGKFLNGVKTSDCAFFVKYLNSNSFSIVAVPSLDSRLVDLCASDSDDILNTTIIIYECYGDSSIANGDHSAKIKIKTMEKDDFVLEPPETEYIRNLITDLECLFYESWFRTARISLALWGNIDFTLDQKILNRCIRKVEMLSISNILRLFNEADICMSSFNIAAILSDWVFVDCRIEDVNKRLWTFISRRKMGQSEDHDPDHYFVELSLEGDMDGSTVMIPLFHDFPKVPQTFIKSCSIVITIFYFEPKSMVGFNATSVVNRINVYLNSFALNKLVGSSVDCIRIKELLDYLTTNELPESINDSVSANEVEAFLVGDENTENLLEVLRSTVSDRFFINITAGIINVKVVNDDRYWIFVELSNGKYLIKCYSYRVTGEEKMNLITSLNGFISEAIFRANQLRFLSELIENRMASDYLISPNMAGVASGSLSSDLKYNFDIGAFQCPLIFEHDFLLFHRLPAELALNAINGVMQPFCILNRPGMFVSMRKDMYGRLFIYYMHFIRTPSCIAGDNDSVSLRMYGIEKLHEGFLELVNMIHSKLEALAIKILGTWIYRNGATKLLNGDYKILLPFDKLPPSKHMIHKCQTDPYAFLTLIRKKLIGCFIPMLETPKEIMNCYFVNRFAGKVDSSRIYCNHVVVYNCSSPREPTELEKQVGVGVCSILINILDSESNPVEWREPSLPLKNEQLLISVEIWPHETLNLDFLTREILSYIKQSQIDLNLSLEVGQLYARCMFEDAALDFSAFSSIDNSFISNKEHNDIHHYEYHLNIESYIATVSDIIFEEISKLCDGSITLKKYQKVDRGNEIQTLIVGFKVDRPWTDYNSPLSSNDLQLLSLTNVEDSNSQQYASIDSRSFEELLNLEIFLVSLQKSPHMSAYHLSADFALDLSHILYRWVTNFDLKNQNVSPIIFEGMSVTADNSHLAAIDVFEAYLHNERDKKFQVFEREIQLQQWTAFPLINEQMNKGENEIISKRNEWNSRYQKEILQTFGVMLKGHGFKQTQNTNNEPFKFDNSKISSVERYYYQVDSSRLLNVVQSNIRGNYFYVSHFLISKDKGSRKEDLLRRLVVGLFEKHVTLTTELILTKETGYPGLLEKLKILHQTFPKAPAGSRSFLVKGFYVPKDANVSWSLFQYIFLNPKRYGFSPLLDNIGCFIRANSPDFRIKTLPNTVEGEEYDYILVLYYNRQQVSDAEPIFKYYIVVLNLTPLEVNQDLSASEYIGSGYYLGDIVRNAEKRIIDLLAMSLKYYSRDSLWRQLQDSQELVCRESSEWVTLFLEKIILNSKSFFAVDATLEDLFSNTLIDWKKVLNHLCKVFKGHLLIQESSTHFILYNESNSDYLVHLSVSINGCEAYIVSREGVSDPIEWEAIDRVVNEILLFLVSDDNLNQ